MYHYTYRITNINENKYYYGSRSSKLPPKDDLGVVYFSSSTDKQFRSDQKQNPNQYSYKVIKVYPDRKHAVMLEIKLHNKFNVKSNPAFYNKANQTSTGFTVTAEVGKAISKALAGKPNKHKGKKLEEIVGVVRANELKEKNSRPMSDDTKRKLSIAHTGKKLSEEHKRKIVEHLKRRVASPETCEKIRQNKLDNHVLRDKTYNEYYGDRADDIKKKMSAARLGRPKPLSASGSSSVRASNTRHKTIIYKLELVNGEVLFLSLSQIQDHFNITKDTAQKLTKFKKPSNKSKYTNIYNTLVSVTDVGVLKDFILPE